jgi:hypothetical protein
MLLHRKTYENSDKREQTMCRSIAHQASCVGSVQRVDALKPKASAMRDLTQHLYEESNVSCLGSSDETEPQSGQRSFATDDQRGPTSAVKVTEDRISMVPDSMGVGAAAISI